MASLGPRLAALAGRGREDPWPDGEGSLGGRRSGWTWPALRSLGLLLALGAAVVGWWWWSGRPAPAVPVVTATGSPLPGARPADPVDAEASEPIAPTPPSPSGEPSAASASAPAETAPAGPPPDAASADSAPPPTIVVHVIGMVRRPGLVTLPAGARVADAVAAAGGVTKPRSADTVNLARPVLDGEQILVGAPGSAVPAGGAPPSATPPRAGPSTPGQPMPQAVPVDLNTAGAEALDELPGIGPVLAGRIVDWRTAHGPFRSIDELGEVVGIGPSLVERLRPHVRV
jgi:competence protein ComEA